MAQLQQQDGSYIRNIEEIQEILSSLHVQLKHWPINT